jgi:hypothetical protein
MSGNHSNINWQIKEPGDQYLVEGIGVYNDSLKVATDSLRLCLDVRLKKGKKWLIRGRQKHLISEVISFC